MRRILVATAGVVAALGDVACATTPDTTSVTQLLTPDYSEFAGSSEGGTNPGVHIFLEKRCGTLDCHGQTGRPFRLFSQDGLRAANDAGIVSGLQPDTPDEVYSNYLSAVGLQPEEMSRVVAGDDPPTDLLLIIKPTGLATHKGGQVIDIGDPSYVCLTTWLTSNSPPTAAQSQLDMSACETAAMVP